MSILQASKNKSSMENQNPPSLPISDPETTQTASTTACSPNVIVQKLKSNLVLSSKWAELNGSMGDLGTYIPIVLALTLSRDLNLGTTFIFTGVYNIVIGVIYGVGPYARPANEVHSLV